MLLLSYCKEHWDGTYVHLSAHVHAYVLTHTLYLVFIMYTLLPSPFITLLSPALISYLYTYPRSFHCPPISLFILHSSLFFTRTSGLSIAPLSASDRKEVMSISHRWFLEDFDVVAFAYTPVHNHVRSLSFILHPYIVIILYENTPCNFSIC